MQKLIFIYITNNNFVFFLFIFKREKKVKGNADFRECKITTLNSLEEIGGDSYVNFFSPVPIRKLRKITEGKTNVYWFNKNND